MHLTERIYIYASRETIFSILNRPYRWPEWARSFRSVRGEFQDIPEIGESWRWVYELGPVHFSGESKLTAYSPNEELVILSGGRGLLETVWHWTCMEIGPSVSKLNVSVSPNARESFLSESLLAAFRRELLVGLTNLKAMIEEGRV